MAGDFTIEFSARAAGVSGPLLPLVCPIAVTARAQGPSPLRCALGCLTAAGRSDGLLSAFDDDDDDEGTGENDSNGEEKEGKGISEGKPGGAGGGPDGGSSDGGYGERCLGALRQGLLALQEQLPKGSQLERLEGPALGFTACERSSAAAGGGGGSSTAAGGGWQLDWTPALSEAWRRRVLEADDALALMECLLLLEASLHRDFLQPW